MAPFVQFFSAGSMVGGRVAWQQWRGIWITSETPDLSSSLELPRSDRGDDPDLEDSEGVSGTKERHIPTVTPPKSTGLKRAALSISSSWSEEGVSGEGDGVIPRCGSSADRS